MHIIIAAISYKIESNNKNVSYQFKNLLMFKVCNLLFNKIKTIIKLMQFSTMKNEKKPKVIRNTPSFLLRIGICDKICYILYIAEKKNPTKYN